MTVLWRVSNEAKTFVRVKRGHLYVQREHSRGEGIRLVGLFLLEGPVDAGGDLGYADGAGKVGALGEAVHEVAPGFGAAGPGVGIGYRVDEGHDAVADEDHGGEVLCAGGCRDEHVG